MSFLFTPIPTLAVEPFHQLQYNAALSPKPNDQPTSERLYDYRQPLEIRLAQLVIGYCRSSPAMTDSTNTIFSNYFVARPNFWTKWLDVTKKLYQRAEESKSGQKNSLVNPTQHRNANNYEFKIFLMERLATLLLSTSDSYKTSVYASTELPMHAPYVPFGRQALACDALKIA